MSAINILPHGFESLNLTSREVAFIKQRNFINRAAHHSSQIPLFINPNQTPSTIPFTTTVISPEARQAEKNCGPAAALRAEA